TRWPRAASSPARSRSWSSSPPRRGRNQSDSRTIFTPPRGGSGRAARARPGALLLPGRSGPGRLLLGVLGSAVAEAPPEALPLGRALVALPHASPRRRGWFGRPVRRRRNLP